MQEFVPGHASRPGWGQESMESQGAACLSSQ